MRRSILGILALLVVLVAPVSASAAPAAGVRVLSTSRDLDGLTVALRCTVAGTGPCRVTVVVTPAARTAKVLGERSVLVGAGQDRAIQVALAPPSTGSRASTAEPIRLTVTARQGDRRLGSTYRRVVRPAHRSFSLGISRFDGQSGSSVVKVQFSVRDGCARRITLGSLVQTGDGVEVTLQDGGASDPSAMCAQAVRNGCVSVILEAPLGERAVWSPVGNLLQSPAPRGLPAIGFGREAWDSCPQVALGDTVDA